MTTEWVKVEDWETLRAGATVKISHPDAGQILCQSGEFAGCIGIQVTGFAHWQSVEYLTAMGWTIHIKEKK